jgi:hypothetical protein
MAAIREKINRNLQKVSGADLYSEVTKKFDELLDISLVDIMAGAWKKGREILKYADGKKYPPEATYLVHLAEHTISSEHRPYVEIMVNEKPVGRVEFKIKISLTLDNFILKIQDGYIRAIQTGTCKGKGTITCWELPILERETASFPLPGNIDLGRGIPIPGRKDAAGEGTA